MLLESNDCSKREVTLIHHAASCGQAYPPGSLKALEGCLQSGAAVIEIDLIPTADGSFALLHDQDLSSLTNGTGLVSQKSRSELEKLTYSVNGKETGEKIGFLEDALDLLAAYPDTQRLQLDLKPFSPLTQAILRQFVSLIKPHQARIQVTSVADWALRALAHFAPDLSLGFDPLLYLDIIDDEPRPDNIPPFRVGAYGIRDDHPLSAFQWGPLGEYFAARAAALIVQAPPGCEWFIRAELLKKAIDAGFNWIDFLHHNGSQVDAWTIDVNRADQIKLAQFLVDRGVDEITTDAPSRLAGYLPANTRV